MSPGDPADPLNDCATMPAKLDQMAALAGLDSIPDATWPDWSDPRVDAIVPLAPGAQYFGKEGLAPVRVPILLFESTRDWAQAAGSAYYEPYRLLATSNKTHVAFVDGDHGLFLNACTAMPGLIPMGFDWFCQDAVWDMDRAHDLINHFTTAFLLAELKGDPEAAAALAPDNVSFPGIEYASEGYAPKVAPPASVQPALDSVTIAQIEAFVAQEMADKDIPGVSLGIVKDGAVAYAQGFGLAEIATHRPMTPQTQFAVACVTKEFTTAAIMQLVEQGLVDLHAPVTDYLPYFKLADERYREITIHHLLANTAGLPMPDYVALYGGFSENPTWSPGLLEAYVRSLADKPMAADPADNLFIYGNDYFDILGEVIAKVSGQSFEAYMQEHLLEPLGLEHTTFIVDELDPALAAAAYWQDETGALQVSVPSPTYYPAHTPSNGMFSTTEDLLKWALLNLNRGALDGKQIVPAAAYDEMWKPQVEIPWGGIFQHWGYAWGISDVENHRLVFWGGGMIGSPNAFYLVPDENLAVHVAVNRSLEAVKGNEYADAIALPVLKMLLGIAPLETAPAAETMLDSETVAQIEGIVQQAMADYPAPGFEMCIVQDGQVVYSEGFGFAEVAEERPATPQSVLIQASVTKSLVAMAVMRLVEQGIVDLDEPVTTYLPTFTMADERYKEITVRMLLSHRGGLPDTPVFWQEPLDPNMDPLEQAVDDLSEMQLLFAPDEDWSYSSYGYSVLGVVIAEVTGQPFATYMQDEWLEPLGMSSSTFIAEEVDPTLRMATYSSDEQGKAVPVEPSCDSRDASACTLWSSCEDMAKLAQFVLNQGELNGTRLLQPESIEAMWTPLSRTPWLDAMGSWYGTPVADYGLGWYLGEVDSHRLVGHPGGIDGANTQFQLAPDDGLAVITMDNWLNAASVTAYPASFAAFDVMYALLGVEPEQTMQSPAVEPTLEPALVETLDAYIADTMAANDVPGLALGVVQDGTLIYAQGYGVTNLDTGEPVTPQTLFQVAEVTMTPTAMAILQLAEAGALDLDAPVTTYLPDFALADPAGQAITVRQLLMHRSGLPDSGDWAADWPALTPELDDAAVERFVRSLAGHALLFPPGEGFEWSDLGYDVLGAVVASVSGQGYEAYMQEHVLTPLGMESSTFLLDEVERTQLATPHVVGAEGQVVASDIIPFSRQFAGANNLYSNVPDLARLVDLFLNRGELDGTRLLPEATIDLMWTRASETPWGEYMLGKLYPATLFEGYGLGWLVADMAGHTVYSGYGGEYGYQSSLALCPDMNLAVIVMGNGVGDGPYTTDATADVLGMLLASMEDAR